MKNLIILSIFFVPHAFSALAPSEGFSGNVAFLTSMTANSSNLDVNQNSSQTLTDLSSSGSTESAAVVGVLGSVQYTFGEDLGKQLFFGTSRDDIVTGTLAFEIGYRQQLDSGTIIDLSFLPTLISGDVWDDPYAIEHSRSKTDLSGNVIRMRLSKIRGSNFLLDIATGRSDVKNERTGLKGINLSEQERALMLRKREYFYLKTGYQHAIENGAGLLTPSVNVFLSNSEGDALSFINVGAEVSYAKKVKNHGFILTASFANREYDKMNPVFSQDRTDKDFGVFLAYEYADILGCKGWSFVSLMGANTTRSTINYYQSSQYVTSVGLGYKF